jgi:four helix bundle protein
MNYEWGREMVGRNIVLDKSYQFAIKVVQFVNRFPKNTEGFVLGDQLLKAGTSIGANVEEAVGAFSKDDFIYKMSIALKEARETNYWLRLIRDSDVFHQINGNPLIVESEELRKILTAIVKSSRR